MRSRLVIIAIFIALGLAALNLLLPRETTTVERTEVPAEETSTPSETIRPPAEPTPAVAHVSARGESDTAEVLPGRIFGRVYDREGVPTQGVAITASWVPLEAASQDTRAPAETATGDDGTFVLENLALGWHLLLARRDEDAARARCQLLAYAPVTEVVLILKARHSIAGIVVAPDGQPVAQATLHPVLNDGRKTSRQDAAGLAVLTDAEGAFHFDAPSPGEWQFLAVAPGYAPTLSPPFPTGTEDARIELLKGVAVSGRVVQDANNAPVAGANILLAIEKLPGPPLRVDSDATGAFTFDAVAPGDYLLEVRANDQTLPEAPMHLAIANTPIANLVLRLVTGGAIRGTVLVRETQEPLVGIEVQARKAGPDPLRYDSGPSGAGGEFEVVGLPPGEYVLNTRRPPGFATVGRSDEGVTVQLQPGQLVEGVVLALSQGLTISGRVLDTDGNPVAGADVRGRGKGWQDQQTSDASGAFILANLTPETEVTLSAATSTSTSGLMGPMTVLEGGLHDIELILSQPRNALLAGVVVDKNSRPLAATVIAWPDGAPVVTYPPTDNSGGDGSFVLPNVTPGAYKLTVKPGDGEQLDVLSLRVEPEQQLRDLRLVYPLEANLAIAGQVVDPDGTGVACTLTVRRQEGQSLMYTAMTSTTITGEFRIEGLSPGAYGIEVNESPGFQSAHVLNVEAGTEDVQIELEPALRLSGQVFDALGRPITDFEIALVDSGGMPGANTLRRRHFQAVSHPDGRFELDVPTGWYEVLVRAEGHETQQFRVGHISPENLAQDLQIILQ